MATEKKSRALGIALVVFALLAGLGMGYFVSSLRIPVQGSAGSQDHEEITFPDPKVDSDKIAAAVVARLDQKLEERMQELAAMERIAARNGKDENSLPEKVADVKAKTPSKPPKTVPTPKVKDDPKPKRTPPSQPIVDDKQKETSPEALKRRTEYTTKLGPSPAIGPDSAVVKVFVISDFQCPVCRRAAEGTHELFDQFGEKVQWIFWQNPLDMHRKAMPTAKASMAAFKQSKFWEYHDVLFQNQRASNTEDILRYAVQLNLDGADFKKAMEEEALLKKIRSDQAAAELIGARGTPAFLINGKLQVGWGSAAGIGSMVTREQKAIEKLLSGGKSLKDALEERARANSKTPEDAEVFITHFLNGEPAERKVEEAK